MLRLKKPSFNQNYDVVTLGVWGPKVCVWVAGVEKKTMSQAPIVGSQQLSRKGTMKVAAV